MIAFQLFYFWANEYLNKWYILFNALASSKLLLYANKTICCSHDGCSYFSGSKHCLRPNFSRQHNTESRNFWKKKDSNKIFLITSKYTEWTEKKIHSTPGYKRSIEGPAKPEKKVTQLYEGTHLYVHLCHSLRRKKWLKIHIKRYYYLWLSFVKNLWRHLASSCRESSKRTESWQCPFFIAKLETHDDIIIHRTYYVKDQLTSYW